jgi:hypothetical protein
MYMCMYGQAFIHSHSHECELIECQFYSILMLQFAKLAIISGKPRWHHVTSLSVHGLGGKYAIITGPAANFGSILFQNSRSCFLSYNVRGQFWLILVSMMHFTIDSGSSLDDLSGIWRQNFVRFGVSRSTRSFVWLSVNVNFDPRMTKTIRMSSKDNRPQSSVSLFLSPSHSGFFSLFLTSCFPVWNSSNLTARRCYFNS